MSLLCFLLRFGIFFYLFTFLFLFLTFPSFWIKWRTLSFRTVACWHDGYWRNRQQGWTLITNFSQFSCSTSLPHFIIFESLGFSGYTVCLSSISMHLEGSLLNKKPYILFYHFIFHEFRYYMSFDILSFSSLLTAWSDSRE